MRLSSGLFAISRSSLRVCLRTKRERRSVANKMFLGLTTTSRRQHGGYPDVNNPKLAIRNEQSKRARKSQIIGGGDSLPLLVCRSAFFPSDWQREVDFCIGLFYRFKFSILLSSLPSGGTARLRAGTSAETIPRDRPLLNEEPQFYNIVIIHPEQLVYVRLSVEKGGCTAALNESSRMSGRRADASKSGLRSRVSAKHDTTVTSNAAAAQSVPAPSHASGDAT
jgi:hypothetical protein